jgi:pimeloyl-ACP methyl ester carboxylesterase
MRSRVLMAAVCAAALYAAGVQHPALSAPAPDLDWRPCLGNGSVDCADLEVPVDWADPGGEKVTLTISRRPAAKPDERVGALVLAGTVRLTNPSRALTDHFDLINYTTRQENTCRARLPEFPAFPKNDIELDQVRNVMRAWYQACEKQVGAGFRHDDSASQARDIDAIRAALGEEQISLMQVWENEIVGQMYAEQFPDRVRAMVLDGNLDHSVETAEEYLALKAKSVENTLRGFAHWCRISTVCALHGQDVGKVYTELNARAERGELGNIAPKELSIHIGSAGDYPEIYWPRLAKFYRDLHDGRTTRLATAPAGSRGAAPQAAPSAPASLPTVLRRGLSYGSFCQDWNFPIRNHRDLVRIIEAEERVAPHVRLNHNHWFNVLGCLGWPFEVGNPPHKLKIGKPLPVLVVNGRYAPGQPSEWADSVAAQIPGSSHLVYEGPGTLAYRESPCVRAGVDAFLVDLTRPQRSTCPAIWPE